MIILHFVRKSLSTHSRFLVTQLTGMCVTLAFFTYQDAGERSLLKQGDEHLEHVENLRFSSTSKSIGFLSNKNQRFLCRQNLKSFEVLKNSSTLLL